MTYAEGGLTTGSHRDGDRHGHRRRGEDLIEPLANLLQEILGTFSDGLAAVSH